MADAERSVLIKLGAKLGPQGKAALGRMRKSIQGLGKLAKRALNFGRILAIGGAAAFGAFLAKGVIDARNFGAAMAQVATLVDLSASEMKALANEVLALSKATGTGPVELANGLFQTISAGVKAGDAMKFLTQNNRLAIAGFANMSDVVKFTTGIINAYGLQLTDVGRVSDIAFASQKEGVTTISELAASMGTVIPFAATLDVSLVDLFAAMSTLTKGMIDTRNAATFLKNVFAGVITASDASKDAAKKYGIVLTAAGFKAQGFAGFIQQLKKATEQSDEAIKEMFPSIRGLTALLALTGKGSKEFAKIQEILKNSTGVVGEALDKINATSFKKFDKSLNNLKIIGIEVGTRVMPGITRALEALAPTLGKMAVLFGDLAEGLGAVIDKPSRFFAGFGQMGRDIKEFLQTDADRERERRRRDKELGFLGRGETEATRQSQLAGGTTADFERMAVSRARLAESFNRRARGEATAADIRKFGEKPVTLEKVFNLEDIGRDTAAPEALAAEALIKREANQKREVERQISQIMGLAPL